MSVVLRATLFKYSNTQVSSSVCLLIYLKALVWRSTKPEEPFEGADLRAGKDKVGC